MRTIRVLFVDDEPLMLRYIERLMQGRGFDLYFEESAKRALDVVMQQSIDIVVADFYMPDASGVDLLKEIYACNPAIVRILMGGSWHRDAINASVGLYAVDHVLKKPWAVGELERLLEESSRKRFVALARTQPEAHQ